MIGEKIPIFWKLEIPEEKDNRLVQAWKGVRVDVDIQQGFIASLTETWERISACAKHSAFAFGYSDTGDSDMYFLNDDKRVCVCVWLV